MGFPACYSDIVLPRFLLRILALLGYVRQLVFWLFKAFGAEGLLDTEEAFWLQNTQYAQVPAHGHAHTHQHSQELSSSLSMTAKKIQETLPVVRYDELAAEAGQRLIVDDSCAVCLCEFEAEDEVRRLSNCRHVFHRGCLDRWTEHEQCTCPLCRTPLVDGVSAVSNCLDGQMWTSGAGDGLVDYEYDDLYSFFTLTTSSALVPPQSPRLVLPSQFLQ